MNELVVGQTLKQFILDNKTTWEAGLTLDGYQKEIQQITSSVLTPPAVYYYVGIDIRNASSYYDDAGLPMPRNARHNTLNDYALLIDDYLVAVVVVDYAVKTTPIEEEVQSFEEEHELFRTLTDRMVNSLDQQDKFVSESGTYSMWIPGDGGDEDRRITKENRYDIWADEVGQHFGIATEISFRFKACSSSS